MNEKQFIVADHSTCVFDKITKEEYVCIDREEAFLICKRLNNQQAIITKLKELNDDKGKRIISLIRTNKTLNEENEQLRRDHKDRKTKSNS